MRKSHIVGELGVWGRQPLFVEDAQCLMQAEVHGGAVPMLHAQADTVQQAAGGGRVQGPGVSPGQTPALVDTAVGLSVVAGRTAQADGSSVTVTTV